MPQLPILSGQEVVKALKKIGYRVMWQKGSHIRMDCSIPGRKRATVPNYKSIDRGLLTRIIRNSNITKEEFLKLL
ncbi:MAG TPA: type II toxin-antitoxin system HicA family toxin [Candidatus Paceibacterota bacterium]